MKTSNLRVSAISKLVSYLSIASLALCSFSYGAVILQSSFDNDVQVLAPTNSSGNFSYTFSSLGSFAAAGTGKLVLGYTSRYSDTDQRGALPTSITYGGAALAAAGQQSGSRATTGIWYLDNVTTDGNLVISFGTNGLTSHVGFSLFALDGLVAGAPTTGASVTSSASPTLTLAATGGFALSTAVRNGGALSPDADYTVAYNIASGNNILMAQYLVSATGGDVTTSATGSNPGGQTDFGWNAAVVPEPSTALLLLGALALILRRRR